MFIMTSYITTGTDFWKLIAGKKKKYTLLSGTVSGKRHE
jgi:hypothetical protein